jgi:AmmeMemoRadiSam system protein B
MNPITPVRPSPIAGSWYPSDPAMLASEIQAYIDQAVPPPVTGEVVGLIAPHAGYFYSGATAGYGYRTVLGKSFDHCVIFSPLHDYLPYDLITSAHSAYGTPLGKVMVDHELITVISEKIQKRTGTSLQHMANDREHSLEIQLPFLQQVLASPFTLVPIMVRTHEPGLLKNTAQAVAEGLTGLNVLLVASTDLSHFYSERDANDLDAQMLKQMTDFSPEGVLKAESCGEGFACGAGAVAVMLWTAQFMGASKATLLHYSTSAAASGDSTRVVGYGALAITR